MQYYSKEEALDNDVIIELCWVRQRCGPRQDLDACVWQHGVWLPMAYWRNCSNNDAIARHNFHAKREPVLTATLEDTFLAGMCRGRVGRRVAGCFHGLDEYLDAFTYERCCQSSQTRELKLDVGGDPNCWGEGYNYERCCLGYDGAEIVREELAVVGDSFYGLSSVPNDATPQMFAHQ